MRARALSSLISPFFCIVGCFGLGYVLDLPIKQRTRAFLGYAIVVVTAIGMAVWSLIIQVQFERHTPDTIDWSDQPLWAKSFLVYFFENTFGPIGQSYMYW